MPTHASPLSTEPWSHDWGFNVLSRFGDPDEGPTYGVVVSIKATSDTEAERRALTYLINNFDDDDRHRVVATSEGALNPSDGTYRVRLDYPWGGR
jgi:hypothetical protein